MQSPRWWRVPVLAGALLCASARAGETVHLRFMYWGSIDEIETIRRTVAQFEAAHPGIRVTAERTPGHYVRKLLLQQAGGVAPDVVFVGVGGIMPLLEKGVLEPLNPFIERDPRIRLDRFYPRIVEHFTLNGKLYILPRDIAPIGIVYYNKKLFDQARVPYPTSDWSWDFKPRPELGMRDFLSVCLRLAKDTDGDGRMDRFACSAPPVESFLFGNGARMADDLHFPTKVLLNDPRAIFLSYASGAGYAFLS